MSDIKPEDLKRLAEYMGYKAHGNGSGDLIVTRNGGAFSYNPISNAEQCLEIEIKFKMTTSFISSENHWTTIISGKQKSFIKHGKTPSEARVNAAISAIGEQP